jgi:hypothetical protein
MLALMIPNIIWVWHKPKDCNKSGENRVLLIFEKIGQVLCTIALLFFSDTNPNGFKPWSAWLIVSALLMVLYECFWIRFFHGKHTINDFYRPFLGVPIPGATLPAVAFLFLSVYGQLIWLMVASVIFGIGHIGIHARIHE